jgi:hypothetical protein
MIIIHMISILANIHFAPPASLGEIMGSSYGQMKLENE